MWRWSWYKVTPTFVTASPFVPPSLTLLLSCADLPDQLLKEILALTFPKTCVEEEIPLSVELGALPPADQERLLKTKKELSQSVRTLPTCPSSLTYSTTVDTLANTQEFSLNPHMRV